MKNQQNDTLATIATQDLHTVVGGIDFNPFHGAIAAYDAYQNGHGVMTSLANGYVQALAPNDAPNLGDPQYRVR